MVSLTNEIKPSKCHNLSEQIPTIQSEKNTRWSANEDLGRPGLDLPPCLTRVDGFTTEAKLQWNSFSKTLTKTLAQRALHKKMIQI